MPHINIYAVYTCHICNHFLFCIFFCCCWFSFLHLFLFGEFNEFGFLLKHQPSDYQINPSVTKIKVQKCCCCKSKQHKDNRGINYFQLSFQSFNSFLLLFKNTSLLFCICIYVNILKINCFP